MERKTKINAEDGTQEMKISREFDLSLEILFKAYTEPNIVGQWMGTNVLKLQNKKHGSYRFETKDANGNVVFQANGVIHDFSSNRKIVRTFEMDNMPFGVQLEFYEFEKITDETSRLNVHVVYESLAQRDQVLKTGFVQGITMAHNRLQEVVGNLKMTHYDK
jgi:uncharacterized protein YndB with AHSA1/START domain